MNREPIESESEIEAGWPIESEMVVKVCWLCGKPDAVRRFTRWPRMQPVPPRDPAEKAAAETPTAFGETDEHSDNLSTRPAK